MNTKARKESAWRMGPRVLRPFCFFTILLLPGCADLVALFPDRNIRSIAIQDHRFEPKVTIVQAGLPVILTVEGVDLTTLIFSSPSLGIPPTRLRPHAHLRPGGRLMPPDYTTMGIRLELAPLEVGSYELVCACHGYIAKGLLLAR
jgi:hypothetical protein